MTKRPEREPPAYLLERLFKGELPAAQAQALHEQLEQQPGGAAKRQAELEADNEAILTAHPPHLIASAIKQRAQRSAKPQRNPFVMPAFALAAMAAVLLVVFVPRTGTNQAQLSTPPGDEIIGIKGLKPHLVVYRKHEGAPQRLTNKDKVRPGDVLQVAYVVPPHSATANGPFGAIVSVDANGTSTLHFPLAPGDAQPLQTQGETRLPNAYELDNVPGFERFVLVVSSHRFHTNDVTAALQQGRPLSPGLAQFELTLIKELR